jgi:hypothetical protein
MMYGQNFYGSWGAPMGADWFMGLGGLVFALLVIWSLAWKGLALWKAAREGSKVWFVVLLIVNTLGILDILYLYVFSTKKAPAIHDHEKAK